MVCVSYDGFVPSRQGSSLYRFRDGKISVGTGAGAEWDTLARNLTGLLESAEGRIEDYRFYILQLLYLLNAGHRKAVKRSYVTSGQRRIADEAEKWICRDFKAVTTA